MKMILITIIISISMSLFASQTQIILGAYSKKTSAKHTQIQLNKIIENDYKLNKILNKNNIKSALKKSGKYFIVSIGPFNDVSTQTIVLSKLKKIKFPEAYVFKIAPKKKNTIKVIPKVDKDILENKKLIPKVDKDILESKKVIPKIDKDILESKKVIPKVDKDILESKKVISEVDKDILESKKVISEVDKDILENKIKILEKDSDTKNLSTKAKEQQIASKTTSKIQYTRDIPRYVVCVHSSAFISSKDAFFILGNKKYGMMHKSWAFADKKTAQAYAEKNGGCIVDYETYVKMDDDSVKAYVKEHSIVIVKDTNATKQTKPSKKSNIDFDKYSGSNKKSNITSDKYSEPTKKPKTYEDIYSKENLDRYR